MDQYLELLSNNPPNKKTWSEEEQLAYWINAYNALSIKVILDNYPIGKIKNKNTLENKAFPENSIRQIPGAWAGVKHQIGTQIVTLDYIFQDVLRRIKPIIF